MDKPFNLMPNRPIVTEAALIQVAAWLWETEDMIKVALNDLDYEGPANIAALRDGPWD